jgi:small-conductance mechanosensitive channel
MENIVLMLPNFILAVVIVVLFNYVANNLKRFVKKLLARIIDNKALVKFLGLVTHISVILLGSLIAIKILNLDEVVFSVLAGVGIAGLAVGFAFQDIAANFIAGVALVFRKKYPFSVGDIIKTNNYMGVVKEINIRDTMIRTFEGQSVFIPNKMIFENDVNNYSILGKRRVDLGVGVSYGEDLGKVKKVVTGAVSKVTDLIEEDGIEVFFEEFGDSSINFEVRFWIPFREQTDFLESRSQAVMNIKKYFDNNNITIPFPIRTLDFGIKGGRMLSEELSVSSDEHKQQGTVNEGI